MPQVSFSQPGVDAWSADAAHVTGKKYKLTVTVPSGGDPGTLLMSITVSDREGGHNSGTASLPLR